MIAAVTDLIRQAGYVGLFAVVLAENLVPPIPSEIVLPFAGWEVARGELALLPALLAATAGSVTGALILYWLARRGGRSAILATHRVSRVTAEDLDRVDARFRRHGVWLVLAGRCVPGLRSVISVPAGMAHMHLGLFIALTTTGSAIWNAVPRWAASSTMSATSSGRSPPRSSRCSPSSSSSSSCGCAAAAFRRRDRGAYTARDAEPRPTREP